MKSKKTSSEKLSDLKTVLDQLHTTGTVLQFSLKPITFNASKQSAVKELEVRILSTETRDNAVLHKLNNKVRLT